MVVIALDIGGTKIKGIVMTKQGKILHEKKIYIEHMYGKHILSNIIYVIKFLKSITSEKTTAIGLSVSGSVKNGKLIMSGTGLKSLIGTNFKKLLEKRFKIPVIVENDANCFALAESVYGKYKKYKNIVGFIWGTGIGAGIIANNQLIEGSLGGAGEIGALKIPIFMNDSKKQTYDVEHLCGGKYIKHSYGKNILPTKILTLKDNKAKQISKIAITTMAWTLSVLVNTLNPDIIILGGGVSNVPKPIYTKIKKEMKKYCVPQFYKKLKLEKHSLPDDAGVLGAAHLANTIM